MSVHSGNRVVRISSKSNTQLLPILVSKKDAARLLNLCVRTVEQLIGQQKLRVKRVGKRVLLIREDLERFARDTEVGS
jgi:excisionase family DNA binding protein